MGEPVATTARISPTYTSTSLFRPFLHNSQSSISKCIRPVQKRFLTSWGTDRYSYGGIGKTAPHDSTSVCRAMTSRSHRHFGSGCFNYHAPKQPYRITALLLSKCRPTDQLLPLPLMSNLIHESKLQCPCPGEAAISHHLPQVQTLPIQNSPYSTTYSKEYQGHLSSDHEKQDCDAQDTSSHHNSESIHDTDIVLEIETADVAHEEVGDKTVQEVATQTDFYPAEPMCAWETRYIHAVKKDYSHQPLKHTYTLTVQIEEEDSTSSTLHKAVQTPPVAYLPLVQHGPCHAFLSQPIVASWQQDPVKLPHLSDDSCKTSDTSVCSEHTHNTSLCAKVLPSKNSPPVKKLDWQAYRAHTQRKLYLSHFNATTPKLLRREGKQNFFYGYHSSVFRG